MAQKDLDAFINTEIQKQGQKDALGQSLSQGATFDPDTYAKNMAIAAKTGKTTQMVNDFPEQLGYEAKLSGLNVERLVDRNPSLSRFLASNIDNAAIAHDDVNTLGAMEVILRPVDYVRSAVAGAVKTVGSSIKGAGEIDDIGTRNALSSWENLFAPAKAIAQAPLTLFKISSAPAQVDAKAVGGEIKKFGELIAPPKERQAFDTEVAEGIGQIGTQIITSLVTGGSALYYQGADVMADKVAKDDTTQARKDIAVVTGSAITGITEKYGLDKILNRVPPQVKNRTLRFIADKAAVFGIEFAQELTENIMQDVTRKLLTDPNAEIGEGATREATVAGTAAMVVRTALGIKSFRQAKDQQTFFEALADKSKESKLRERNPEKYEELLNMITENGPLQNIFIPQEQFKTYFQSVNRDPEQVAQDLGIANYAEAELAGGDLVIPVSKFVSQIAPSDDLQGLIQDLRLAQGFDTPREAQEKMANLEADIARLREQFESEDVNRDIQTTAMQEIKADIEGQLVQLGMTAKTANDYATIAAAGFRGISVNAYREMSPEQRENMVRRIFKQTEFKVSMPMNAILKDKKIDMQLDPLLESLRSRMSFDEKKIYGPSLIEFLKAKKIKLDDSMGELAARDIDIGRKAFERKLIAQKGDENALGLEEAAEIAHSWGYIPETNERLFLEALDEDLRGNAVYSTEFTDAKLEDYVNQLDALQNYLDRYDIDVTKLSNEEIRAKLDELSKEPEKTPDYYQKDVKNLVVLHNLSSDNIRFIDEFGGLPVPSLGITKVDTPFKGFGDITLIGPKGMVDPAKGVPVFSADAYTARFPELIWDKVSMKKADAFFNSFGEDYKERDLADTWDRMVNYPDRGRAIEEFVKSGTAMRAWLRENGKTPVAPVMESDRVWVRSSWAYQDSWTAKVDELIGRGIDVRNLRPEDDGYSELQDAAMQAAEAEAKKFGLTAEQFFERDISDGKIAFGPLDAAITFVYDSKKPPKVSVRNTRDALRKQIGDDMPAYEKWAADKIKEQFKEPSIKVGGRKVAVTLDNVVDAMATKVVRGREKTMTFSSGQVAARAAKQFKSMEEIQAARDRIVSSDVEAEFKNETDATIDGYMAIAGQYYRFDTGYPDASMKALADANRMGGGEASIRRALIKNDFEDPSPELITAAKDALTAMRGAVTDYFEAKPQRAVMLYEFLGAVVPQNAPKDVLDVLEKNGIYVRQYGNKGDVYVEREQAITELANELHQQTGFVLFQSENQDQQAVIDSARNNIETKRGYVRFGAGENKTVEIALLENRDLSTFLHEMGHVYLEILGDVAQDPSSSAETKADYAAILNFLGVKDRSEIGVKQHEMFARAHEAYLREGKSPNAELRTVFQKFKAWLTRIYKTLQQLDIELNDDIRQVFDRIYATDAEIEAARTEADMTPLFASATAANMTDAEFEAYTNAVRDEVEVAKEKLEQKLLRELEREKKIWWKETRAEMRKIVEAEVNEMPVYRAFDQLALGSLRGEEGIKLDYLDLVARYGEAFVKTLPRPYVYAKKGGVDADTAAEMLGFDSGEELVKALAALKPRKEYIEAETDQRMKETYGDIQTDGSFADEAKAAMHNESRANVLSIELKAIKRKQREALPFVRAERQKATEKRREAMDAANIPPLAVFRQMAQGIIGSKRIMDITPNDYLLAERKYNRKAFKDMAAGNYQEAFVAKQRELINHYMYLEAVKARQNIDKAREYLASFDNDATRQRIAKAGKDYLDQIDTLLEGYELKRIPTVVIEQRMRLADFVQQQEALGNFVNIPQELIDKAQATNYRQSTYDEFTALRDAVKNIEHLAKFKNKLMVRQKAREFENVKAELLTTLRDNRQPTGELERLTSKSMNIRDKGARAWRKFDAAHLKVEQIVEWLDGGQIDGPWARYFFDLADEAQTKEYDLHRVVTKALRDLQENMPRKWQQSLYDKTAASLPTVNNITKYDLIGIALNSGNDGNYQRLKAGRTLQDGQQFPWTDDQINAALTHLTKEDWQFVQGVWDTVNLLWGDIAALEERMTGIAPPKVEARPFTVTTQQGDTIEVAGGYFPIVYDRRMSDVGKKQAEVQETVQDFFSNGHGRATTSKGHTKSRVDSYSAPLNLDWSDTLSYHMSNVIKDISHREAVQGIYKILKDKEIALELEARLGSEYTKMLNDWTRTLVRDRADTLYQAQGLANILMKTRTNMAIVTMGFKATTILAQVAGVGPAMDFVKPRNFYKGMVDFFVHPKQTYEFVTSRSGEMRNRLNTLDRDVKDGLAMTRGETGILPAVRRTAFYATGVMDMAVSMPTWMGAYKQALTEGKSEEDAIRAGDRAVRLSQGAAGAKDMAAVQRNNELTRLLTMYYGPFSALYARLRDVGESTSSMKDLPKAAARLMALVVFPAIIGELLAGRGPDDDEDEVWWAARKVALYPLAAIPVVRDFSGLTEQWMINLIGNGNMEFKPEYRLSPIVSAIDKVSRIPSKIGDVVIGEKDFDEVAWDVFESSGYLLGLPTAQARITGEYLQKLLTGETSPEDAADVLKGLFFRPKKDQNLNHI